MYQISIAQSEVLQLVLEHLLVELFNHIFVLFEAASSDFGQIALDRVVDLLLCVLQSVPSGHRGNAGLLLLTDLQQRVHRMVEQHLLMTEPEFLKLLVDLVLLRFDRFLQFGCVAHDEVGSGLAVVHFSPG